ncbi:TolC family outer membrane protein [Marinobacterium lutimaris]|uniref:Outer membrane protein n=1 Tax=Marinobacterium lutimaris TaxID=568106 RepID=A0A1H5YGD8_9GAMM|nr:TolC family outer membrane protein [Marinobacterium lutimaris]SEG22466.1 outer membrane protein [Marinobacterium lutimaris]
MRIRKRISAVGICFTLATAPANAGALLDLYQKALDADPQLKSAQATFEADSEVSTQARSGLLPQANLNANTARTDNRDFDGNTHGYTLSLSQPLFDASAWFIFRRGQLLEEQAQLTFALAQQDLILRSIDAYLGVLRAQSTLDLAQARERALSRRLEQVQAQFDVGLIAVTDVLDAQASYDEAAVQLIDAQGALSNSFEALERLAGSPLDSIQPLDQDYPIQSVEPTDPTAWLDRAFEGNLTYRISQYDSQAARRSLQAARSEHLPRLTVEAQSGETTERGDWDDNNSIALRLSVPLYAGGSTSSGVREADQRNRAALFNQEDQRRALTLQTRSLLRDLNTSVESVKARAQSIKSRETALQANEEGFSVGTRNVVDVLDAENALYQALLDYANSRYDHITTLFEFKQTVGSLSPEDLIALDQWLTYADMSSGTATQ